MAHAFEDILVNLFVHVQCRVGCESFRTLIECAFKDALFHVNTAQMVGDDTLAAKMISANVAFVLFDFLVERIDMVFVAAGISKLFITIGAVILCFGCCWSCNIGRALSVILISHYFCIIFLGCGCFLVLAIPFNGFRFPISNDFFGHFLAGRRFYRHFYIFIVDFIVGLCCHFWYTFCFDCAAGIQCVIQHVRYQFKSGHIIVAHFAMEDEIVVCVFNVIYQQRFTREFECTIVATVLWRPEI